MLLLSVADKPAARREVPVSWQAIGHSPEVTRQFSVEPIAGRLRFLCDEAITFRKKETKMGSTSDKVVGKANELAGQARQGVGKAMDDKEMQAKGVVQEAKGDAQQAKGDAKDAIKKVVDNA